MKKKYDNFEIIITNDNSTDVTAAICVKLSAEFSRIKRSSHRLLLSLTYNFFIGFLFKANISDYTVGLKAWKKMFTKFQLMPYPKIKCGFRRINSSKINKKTKTYN